METQDHKKPKQQGHEGHSGGSLHVCSKCGWPFPNPHPSAKQRRAHKKVCGTVEGFKLDSDDSQNNTHRSHMMGDSVADDEHKPPSVTPVERTVSRRSNSGAGSRSSRSTRSEDDVFTDAVTDFNDSQNPGEAADGGIQRFYSMQRVTQGDLDEMKQTAENASADNLCSPNLLPKDSQDQGQNVYRLEGETDRVEAAYISPDFNSSSASGLALIPDLVAVEHDNKIDSSDEIKELVSSKEKLELKTAYEDTAEKASENVPVMNTVDEVILDTCGAGETAKSTGLESAGSENSLEKSEVVYAPGTIHSLDHPVGITDAANGNLGKTRTVEDHGSWTRANEDVYVLAVPNDLPLRQNPDIAIEDLDHKGGKFNGLKVPDPAKERRNSEEFSAHVLEEVGAGIDLKTADNKRFIPEEVLKSDDGMEHELKQDVRQKIVVEESTVGEAAQLSDVIKASDTGIESKTEVDEDFKTENLEDEKVSFAKAEKPSVSVSSVFPEGDPSTDATANVDITYGTSDAFGSVENNREHVILQDVEGSDVSRKELSGSSSLAEAECAISGIPPRVSEPYNFYDINDTGNDEKIGVEQTRLDGNKVWGENEGTEAVTAESALVCDSSAVGSHGSIHEPIDSEKIYDHDNSDKRVDSGDNSVGISIPMNKTVGSSVGAECVCEYGTGANPKSDDIPGSISSIPSDTLEVRGDPQQHLQSSAAVSGIKKFAEEASGANEGDRTLNQHVAVSAGDVLPDSSSLSDSLEGNWGSASVLSTISDTPPATPPAEENASLELKPVKKSQQYESKISDEPQVGFEKKEGASEIETLEEHQQKGSALQTALSSSVTHADNAPSRGKREEEIVSKVTDWSADKNHTPLKTLLGEATAISRAESPIHNPMEPKANEIPVAKNEFPKTENVILSSNVTSSEASKEEMGKEWNSPARYPVNIKTEKRKAKGKPYWAPFLCCSSVNAR